MARWFQVMLVLATVTLAVPLLADHGNGKSKGNSQGNQASDNDDQGDNNHWERRGDYEYRTYGEHEGVPPGWSKGKKTGWGNCGMPPGQAKKHGCQSYQYEGRDYYYYRDEVGHIVVRRPSIHIEGGGIDIH